MTTAITTYKDLCDEKKRLTLLVEQTKAVIKDDFNALREGIQPAADALSVMGKLTSRDKTNPLINFGVDFVVDVLVKKVLLAKVGWIPRIVVPFVLKNFGSNILEENKKFGFLKNLTLKNFNLSSLFSKRQ